MKRRHIEVSGIVQGVGFRPFIFGMAQQHQLVGWVLNHSQGVSIEVQGIDSELELFIRNITQQAPPLSHIDNIEVGELDVLSEQHIAADYQNQFSIHASPNANLVNSTNQLSTHLSPDFSLCADCLDDIYDPNSRYYRYPLTNCTHCGPRFSIIKALPYDRKNTSMADFAMCDQCLQAYQDPSDRRYHAQPISCPNCGPQIQWRMANYSTIPDLKLSSDQVLQHAANAILAGGVVAIKGIGGFHLVCDATNAKAVDKLRASKHRPTKPLAIMVKNRAQAEHYVEASAPEWQLLESQQRPITLLRKRQTRAHTFKPVLSNLAGNLASNLASKLVSNIATNVPYLGLMMPYTPLHHLLFDYLETPLVFTSANRSGQPILINGADVAATFKLDLAGILDHPRDIINACDDSLVHFAGGQRQMLRLGRGFAPFYFPLPNTIEQPILAAGAQQKVSFAIGAGQNNAQSQALISPYIGDLTNLEMQQDYQQRINSLTQLHQITVAHYVCDQHPRYVSHLWAQQQLTHKLAVQKQVVEPLIAKIKLDTIQHHYAHVLSVMAEHQLNQTVLGFSFDGTGFGQPDELATSLEQNCELWGGEVLIANTTTSQRCCSLKPFRLIGGEQAITSPTRLLLALLLEYYSLDQIKALQLNAFASLPEHQLDNWHVLWSKGINSPYTSSIGRFIDAYCALVTDIESVNFEGECGLKLEQLALQLDSTSSLPIAAHLFEINQQQCDWLPLLVMSIDALKVNPLKAAQSSAQQTEKIQSKLAQLLFSQLSHFVLAISEQHSQLPIVLCGGVFQNRVLMDIVCQQLKTNNKPYYVSQTLPLNDGGIAAGQLWFAAHQKPERDTLPADHIVPS
nr:carbamoyltransferase HypF [Vibrio sp. S11_S32]